MEINKDTIFEIRVELGFTLEEFARLLGVGVATVHCWETGKQTPNRTNRKIIENKIKKFLPIAEAEPHSRAE